MQSRSKAEPPSRQGRSRFKRIIVVTGTPGVGKTMVSEKLATMLGAVHVDVADLVRREGITSGYDEKRQTLIADDQKLAKRVQQIIDRTRKKVIIIDGHYATGIAPKGQIAKVFVLRCHPDQLRQRMEKRGFQGSKLRENLAAEILDVCLTDAVNDVRAGNVCEIDTTNKTADAVSNEVTAIWRERKPCSIGIVDWLGQLEIEGSLEQYLREF